MMARISASQLESFVSTNPLARCGVGSGADCAIRIGYHLLKVVSRCGKVYYQPTQQGRHAEMATVRTSGDESRRPNPIDIQVGSRVRLRRNMLGLSQEKLGTAIGLTFQQVQKYERGANRVSVSRLHELSRVLDVPVSFFFGDMDPVRALAIPGGFSEPPAEPFESDPLRKRETVELANAYYAIDDAAVRRCLLQLAVALTGKTSPMVEPARRRRRRGVIEMRGVGSAAARDTCESTRNISTALPENPA